jgi:hypothetical protein
LDGLRRLFREQFWGCPTPVKEASPELDPHSDAVFRTAEAVSEKGPFITGLLRRTKGSPEELAFFCNLALWICRIPAAKVEYAQKRGGLIMVCHPSIGQ